MDLCRLLQKANLSSYYDAFVSNGGDDIQQLLDASDEELQEILRVVGMGNKPLHVIRLKKVLTDFKINPDKFLNANNTSIQLSISDSSINNLAATQNMLFTMNDQMRNYVNVSAFQPANVPLTAQGNFTLPNGNLLTVGQAQGQHQLQANDWSTTNSTVGSSGLLTSGSTQQQMMPRGIPVNLLNNAVLSHDEKTAIESAAEDLVKAIPEYPIKEPSPSRKREAGLFEVIKMSVDNPSRNSAIYRYSCIYGRFNKARKTGKPMNLHEVAVNEASYQLCLRMPSLLSRREDLYPLARQVVKIAEDVWKSNYRFKNHKKKKPNPNVVAIAQEFVSYHETNPQGGYLRAQEKIEFMKGQLCDLITQQDKLRIAFRAAKEGSAGPSMTEIQKQIDSLSGIQQSKIAELGRYVLELRRFHNEMMNTDIKHATVGGGGGGGTNGNEHSHGIASSSSSNVQTVSLIVASNSKQTNHIGSSNNLLTSTQVHQQQQQSHSQQQQQQQQQQHQQQQHFITTDMNNITSNNNNNNISPISQHLLSLAPASSASNMFTVFPTGAAGLPQMRAEQSNINNAMRTHPTFLLSNSPMAALTAVANSSAAATLNLANNNNQPTSTAYTLNNSQIPSFSVFTSFGQVKPLPVTTLNSGGSGNEMTSTSVSALKLDESPSTSAGQVHSVSQYNLLNIN